VDKLFADAGTTFWVTLEFDPQAEDRWNPEEIQEGLNRTYRIILQRDYRIPEDLVERIKLIPQVEEAHVIDVAHAPLPQAELTTQSSLTASHVAEMI
jgi:hypothetical protein